MPSPRRVRERTVACCSARYPPRRGTPGGAPVPLRPRRARSVEWLVGIQLDAPFADRPSAGNDPVHQVRADGERIAGAEDPRPVRLRHDPSATRMDEQVVVPMGKEANRCGDVRIRQRRARKIKQVASLLVAMVHEVQTSADPLDGRDRQAGPRRDIPPRGGTEAAQVRRHDVPETLVFGGVARTDPRFRERQGDPLAAAPRCPRVGRGRGRPTAPDCPGIPTPRCPTP